MDVVLRRLAAGDIGQVIDIEREAFSPLWVSTPFKRELNNRYASYLVAYAPPEPDGVPVADSAAIEDRASHWHRLKRKLKSLASSNTLADPQGPFVAGYVSVWYQGEEAHITEIAVRENLRGRGIGELLLIGSLRAAVEYGSKVMTLEVRVSNFIAQRLYEKYGFKSVGIRKAYYSDNREDAVIMTTNPIDSEEYQRMFQEMLVIGLTGSIGTGKSEVARLLQELGAAIIDADLVGHEAYKPNTESWCEVVKAFGEGILQPNGEINRPKLGSIVFSDPDQLAKLNGIMHPRMARMVAEKLNRLRCQGTPVAVVEAALLYEAGWDSLVDEVWVTDSPVEAVIERLQARSGLSAPEVLKRIDSQMDRSTRLEQAQVVVDNSADVAELKRTVTSLWDTRVKGRIAGE